MNRAFTTREKVLLVILAVLIIGIGYFKLLLEPINTSIENYRNMTASEQDEILVNTALLQKKKQMETELEELFASGDPTPIPVYDNSGNLLVELHRILDKSLDYSLNFSGVSTMDVEYLVRRPVRAAVGILTAAALLIAGISIYSSRQETRVLNVYNWGEYISDGSDDSLDTIAAFEDWYKATYGVPVKVNYDTYASNEDMYAKLKSGAVSYDVVIPSDYMIARMEAEDMLLPLNYDNIPNYQYISEDFRGLYYDPDDTYTVPYTYGIVGVIYNANVVDEADTGSWDLMWNPKYASNILQFNNARDALGTAMYRAGIDVNTTDHADWQQALQALVDQRPLVKSYVMDEIYNMMESGEAAVAAYYAGDYFTMCDAQADSVDLQFYYPENTNYFIDAMCIPTSCRDQELAECFINFMLSREAAVANAEYIYYASPNRLVYDDPEYIDDMGEDTMAILYPDIGSFRDAYNRSAYRNLDQDTLTYVNSLWETLKIN